MDISQILKSSTAGTTSSTSTQTTAQNAAQAAAKLSPASLAINKAGNRIQTQLDTTSAQLSAYGKLKSAMSDTQLAAKSLRSLTSASSAADIKAALGKLVSTFNTTISTGKTTSGITDSSNAKRVSSDLGRAVSSNPAVLDALKKIGFKQATDGTLTLDASKFSTAQKADPAGVEATMEKLANLVDKVATKELAAGSVVAGSIESLTQRSSLLKTQKNAMVTLMEQLATQTSSNTGFGGYGISAYQSNS